MDVRPIAQSLAPLPGTAPGTRDDGLPKGRDASRTGDASVTLGQAAVVDIGTSKEPAEPTGDLTRYIRDRDTRSIVFQVVDPTWGEILAQMPSVSILRNRAYAAAAQTIMAHRTEDEARRSRNANPKPEFEVRA